MHEASLAQGLLRLVEETITQYVQANPGKPRPQIKKIICESGLLACFEPVALSECFEILTEGTPLATAKLIVEIAPLKCQCAQCGKTFTLRERKFHCPGCGGDQIKFKGGNGLVLKSICAEDEGDG